MPAQSMDQLVALCKRRGFIFQGSDIYGGLQGTYDYGPLGVELKNNLKAAWWKASVYERDDMEGLDASILMNRMVLKHSGHEATFTDPLVDNRETGKRYRLDHLLADQKQEVLVALGEALNAAGESVSVLVEKLLENPENASTVLKTAKVADPENGKPGNWTEPRGL